MKIEQSPTRTNDAFASNEKRITATRGLQFPWKLHQLLEECEKNGDSHIVSWMPDGKAFKVHKKEDFCEKIMPLYFSSSVYKTFQRSLNLWGYGSVSIGPNKGASQHPLFVRGMPDLCEHMVRVRVKKTQVSCDAVPTTSSTFAAMKPRAPLVPPHPSIMSLLSTAPQTFLGANILLPVPGGDQVAAIDSEIAFLVRQRASITNRSFLPAIPTPAVHGSSMLRASESLFGLPPSWTNFPAQGLRAPAIKDRSRVLDALSAAQAALELTGSFALEDAAMPS